MNKFNKCLLATALVMIGGLMAQTYQDITRIERHLEGIDYRIQEVENKLNSHLKDAGDDS